MEIMNPVFRIMLAQREEGKEGIELRIGMETESGSGSIVTYKVFHSYEELKAEIEAIERQLQVVLEQAKGALAQPEDEKPGPGIELLVSEDPSENWRQLEELESDEVFFHAFNRLEDEKRKAVADYVLSSQNIFKGRASLFSLHYDDETSTLK
jgi:hypothetical protein